MKDTALFLSGRGNPLGNWPEGEAKAGVQQSVKPELLSAEFLSEAIRDLSADGHGWWLSEAASASLFSVRTAFLPLGPKVNRCLGGGFDTQARQSGMTS